MLPPASERWQKAGGFGRRVRPVDSAGGFGWWVRPADWAGRLGSAPPRRRHRCARPRPPRPTPRAARTAAPAARRARPCRGCPTQRWRLGRPAPPPRRVDPPQWRFDSHSDGSDRRAVAGRLPTTTVHFTAAADHLSAVTVYISAGAVHLPAWTVGGCINWAAAAAARLFSDDPEPRTQNLEPATTSPEP